MKQFKLIPLAVLASLTMSSCSDLLEKDSEDTVTIDQYLTSDDNLLSFTYHLYGPFTWTNYDSKFSWCANELSVGNVYHNFADEGAFFFLQFSETNPILANGYECLYGVISRCNMIINELDKQCGSGISAEAKNRAKGEAYLMRGYCYFLLTEYWGEVPIILNNNKTILNDKANDVKKASRRCVYAQTEYDYKKAQSLLPSTSWGNNKERPSNVAAKGMLAKLYLTMGAAAASQNLAGHEFKAEKSFAEYNQMAKQLLEEIIATNPYLESTANYENIFWPKTYNQENLFSLHFEQGPYGAGSQRQIMWGRSKYMNSGGNAYGGEKGLTSTLFEYFEASDVRKKACSYYADGQKSDDAAKHEPVYKMYDGSEYVYYYNPSKTMVDKKGLCTSPYGDEPEMPCKNALRKFVYRMPITNEFSAAVSLPILRTADLYLMLAEAKMAIETGAEGVYTQSAAGINEVNKIRERAGLQPQSSIALYQTADEYDKTFVDERDPAESKPYTYKCYRPKYDLFTERRHEFALELQNWLDLKRIYYRNQESATEFLARQDRGLVYSNALGVDVAKGDADYQRKYELHMADESLPAETPIDSKNVTWFFPTPSTVSGTLSSKVFDDVDQIKKGSYPY